MDNPVGRSQADHSPETGRIADLVAGSWEEESCSGEDIGCRGPTCLRLISDSIWMKVLE